MLGWALLKLRAQSSERSSRRKQLPAIMPQKVLELPNLAPPLFLRYLSSFSRSVRVLLFLKAATTAIATRCTYSISLCFLRTSWHPCNSKT